MPAGQSPPMTIVSCPAPDGNSRGDRANRFDRARQARHDPRIADESIGLVSLGHARAHAASLRDRLDLRLDIGERGRAALIVWRANIDRELHMARNDVGRARPDFETADGRDEVGFAARARLDRQRHFGRGRQRVAAEAHRRRAGMAGYSVYADLEPGRAVDGRHDAERQTFGLQHRPLFDMRLDEGGDMVRGGSNSRLSGSPPKAFERSRIATPLASFWSSASSE